MTKSGSPDFPPRPFKKKEEDTHESETGTRSAEAPEKLDLSIAKESSTEILSSLDDFYTAWLERMRAHNIYTYEAGNNPMRDLWEKREQAATIVGKIRDLDAASTPDVHINKSGTKITKGFATQDLAKRAEYVDELKTILNDINGSITDSLNERIAESTPKEMHEANAAAVEEIASIMKPDSAASENRAELQLFPERQAMLQAETAYFDKYKEYFGKKGSKEGKEPDDLIALKKTYDESRVAYGRALSESAAERLDTRGPKLDNHTSQEVLERYNRLVRFREVVAPTAEKQYQARLEALGSREQSLFNRGLAWARSQNQKLEDRFGKNGARFVRAASMTAVAGVGAAAAGAFATSGLLGALGWGTYRLGRSLGSSFAGAAAGKSIAEVYGATLGDAKQRRAEAGLASVGRTSGDLDILELASYDAQRRQLQKKADPRTLTRQKAIIQALASVGFGAGMSGLLAELPSAHEGIAAVAHAGAVTPDQAEASAPNPFTYASNNQYGFGHAHASDIKSMHDAFPGETNGASAPSGISGHAESLAVGGKINTADKLLGHFREQLEKQYAGSEQPAAVKAYLEAAKDGTGLGHEDAMTTLLKFQDGHGGTGTIHPGDTVRIENGTIIFHNASGDQVIVDAEGHLHPVNLGEMHQTGAPVEHPETHAEHVAPERAAQSEHAPTAAPEHPEHSAAPHALPMHGVPNDILQQPLHQYDPVNDPHITLDHPAVSAEHAVPSVSEHPASAGEVVVEAKTITVNGQTLDLRMTHIVESRVGKGSQVIIGGTPEERLALAQAYLKNPIHKGATLYAEGVNNPATGKPFVDRYFNNDQGVLVREPNLQSKYGGIFGLFGKTEFDTVPDPTTFTKVIQ